MSEHDISKMVEEARSFAGSGRFPEARALYEQICNLDKENTEAWLMLGGISGMLGNYIQAEDCCRKAAALQPDSADAHMNLANALLHQRKLDEAITSYRAVVQLQPNLAPAWYMLGRTQTQLGATDEAESSYHQAITLQPDYAEAHTHLGMLLHSRGEHDTAEASYRETLNLNPDQPQIHFNLGVILQEKDKFEAAEACYHKAVQIRPDYSRAHANLGYTLRMQEKLKEAVASYQQALETEPDNAEIHHNLGLTKYGLGQFEEAAASHRKAIQLNPDYAEAYLDLASILQVLGNYHEALINYQHALHVIPDHAQALHGKASTLVSLGTPDEAVDIYQQLLRIKPDSIEAYVGLGGALMIQVKPEEAMSCCEKALQIQPDNPDAITLAATIADQTGDPEKAYKLLAPLLANDVVKLNVAQVFGVISKSLGRQNEAITIIEQLLNDDDSLPDSARRSLHFNLGKLYDATDEYDKAFSHFQQGNASKPFVFDSQRHALEIDTLIEVFSAEFMARIPRADIQSSRPVFIVGMARSGTSLVEQILASHPAVFGAGELRDIIKMVMSLHVGLGTNKRYPQCIPLLTQDKLDALAQRYLDHIKELASDATRVIDKMPGNFMHLGLIELMFPNARIIHAVRDPLDTCLSIYFQDFSRSHPYSYDLANLGAFYRGYRKLMRHWRQVLSIPIMEIQYEELVANQEKKSRELIEFCGLTWDDQCLEFHKAKRFVGTASYNQVRRPMYKKSVARWKNYEQHIELLVEALKE